MHALGRPVLLLAFLLAASSPLYPQAVRAPGPGSKPAPRRLDPGPRALDKVSGAPAFALINVNRAAAWYSANGEEERQPFDGSSGLTFPRGTSTAVYCAGIVYGAVYDDGAAQSLRLNGTTYRPGFKPGAILGLMTGQTEDPQAPDVRLWRVRKDYATADLRRDAAEFFLSDTAGVSDIQVAFVRKQYETDWIEWPAHKGAPFYDADGDGVYTPRFTGEVIDSVQVPVLYPLAVRGKRHRSGASLGPSRIGNGASDDRLGV